MIFPFVQEARQKSARLAYEYFHSEHERVFGYRDDFVFSDDQYEFDWFVNDMEDARRKFLDPDEQQSKTTAKVLIHAARAVENGGRDAMIHAVNKFEAEYEDDDSGLLDDYLDDDRNDEKELRKLVEQTVKKSKKKAKKTLAGTSAIKGWARVPTTKT